MGFPWSISIEHTSTNLACLDSIFTSQLQHSSMSSSWNNMVYMSFCQIGDLRNPADKKQIRVHRISFVLFPAGENPVLVESDITQIVGKGGSEMFLKLMQTMKRIQRNYGGQSGEFIYQIVH